MPDIEARLTRLERTTRRWRAVAVCAVLLVPLLGLDQSVPDEIKTRRLTVVDDSGNQIARLGREEDGAVLLFLHTTDGSATAMMTAGPQSADVLLSSPARQRDTTMTASPDFLGMTTSDKAADALVCYGPGARGALVWGGLWSGGPPRAWLRTDQP